MVIWATARLHCSLITVYFLNYFKFKAWTPKRVYRVNWSTVDCIWHQERNERCTLQFRSLFAACFWQFIGHSLVWTQLIAHNSLEISQRPPLLASIESLQKWNKEIHLKFCSKKKCRIPYYLVINNSWDERWIWFGNQLGLLFSIQLQVNTTLSLWALQHIWIRGAH